MEDEMVEIRTLACMVCHKSSAVHLTPVEFEAYKTGEHIQIALPNRTPAFRELLITGTHGDCWNKMFHEGDMDDDGI